ncbi:MAG: outer membrane protein assembly factor BamA [Opitutae bacterium]
MKPFLILSILFLGFITLHGEGFYEGKVISSIKVDISGPPTVGKSYIKQNLQVEEGSIYGTPSIDKSIRNLMDTGSIKDVKVFIDPEKSNQDGLTIVFKVVTKPRIEKIIFEGNDKLSNKKLSKTITLQVGELYDESMAKSDKILLEDLYLEKGFWNSSVNYQITPSKDDPSKIILQFDLVENDSRKIRKILFSGNTQLKDHELLDVMETAPWRFWRFWSQRSKYQPRVLEEDLDKISQSYRNEGFLDVKIDHANITLTTVGSSRIDLHIKIEEGSRSYFGKQRVLGQAVLDEKTILGDSLIKAGNPYSPVLLSKERSRIKRLYGNDGYLDTQIRVNRKSNLEKNQIDLDFEITENNKFTVNSIEVRGNEKTKTIVLIRELALAPGETFDLTRMETSEARLQNTRLFERVNITDEPISSGDPELRNSRRNLVVDVEEGRTGHVSFGVGFSTLEKAMMYAEFRQGNFDLMKWRAPHRLQGDGQKFRLRLKLGSRSNEARLALEEPWFLNRRVAAGFEIFREKSDYQSSYYDELRAGFEIYFRKRLFELVEGRLFYSYEDVLIEDIELGAKTFWITNPVTGDPAYNASSNEIQRTISKVGLSLSRDTRDALLFPTEGSIFIIRKEFAGGIFGGDADYGRFEVQGARFFKTFDAMEQVLSVSGRAGTLGKFDGKDANVPFFEKFFLGGPYNLRGWDYRDAGPNDPIAKEPTGGNSYSYASLEYTFKVADPLRFALFYDGGFLRRGDFKLSPGSDDEGWHDNWGLGIRIMVMGMPLRLDLGFPLADPSESGSSTQFHFSGGTRF